MSFIGDIRHTPAATKPPGTTTTSADDPLTNLSAIQTRMDNLHRLLSDSVKANTPLGQPQLDVVSSEISSAIHHIILNAAALLSTTATTNPPLPCPKDDRQEEKVLQDAKVEKNMLLGNGTNSYDHIIELDAVELLAEHVHFCEICGKGFKRDANLRMHMRAHGNQFKTPEALAKPDKGVAAKTTATTRFSCPYVGCNRNRQHKKFRPLKSVICVRNHFKRSHCPKMFSCSLCNKKSFSVVADLRSHLKHCGESKWRCSCGTSFSRKDKLFGHMALFEGHMPAVAVDGVEEEEDTGVGTENRDGVFDGSDSIENYFFGGDVVFSSPNSSVNVLGSGMEGFFNF